MIPTKMKIEAIMEMPDAKVDTSEDKCAVYIEWLLQKLHSENAERNSFPTSDIIKDVKITFLAYKDEKVH